MDVREVSSFAWSSHMPESSMKTSESNELTGLNWSQVSDDALVIVRRSEHCYILIYVYLARLIYILDQG